MIPLIGGIVSLVKMGADFLSRNGTTVLALTQNHIANKNLETKKLVDNQALAIQRKGQEITERQITLHENTLSFQKYQTEAQMKRDYLQIVTNCVERAKDRDLQWDITQSNQNFQGIENEKNRALQWVINQSNQEFQERMKEKDWQENRALTEYIQSVQIAINQKNIDFGMWKVAQDRLLALELKEIEGKLAWALREFDRETQLQYFQEKLNSEKEMASFPLYNSARQILSNATDATLRIVYLPVGDDKVNPRFPSDKLQLLVETKLSELANFYSQNGRSVKFLGGAYNNPLFRAESAALSLHSVLKSVPFLILDAVVKDDIFSLSHRFWAMSWDDFRSNPLIPTLSWHETQIAFAQEAVLQWLREREEAENNGEDVTEIDAFYGDDQIKLFQNHLAIMQREKKALETRKSLDRVHRPYDITKHDINDSAEFLAIWHCIYAGLFADEYFLLYAPLEKPLEPILPSLLPNLLQGFSVENQQIMLKTVLAYYEIFYQGLIAENNQVLIPDLRLKVISPLVNNGGIVEIVESEIKKSMTEWLQLRNFNKQNAKLIALTALVEARVTIADQEYIKLLNQCLTGINQPNLNLLNGCFNRGLHHCRTGEYALAIEDFSQTIQLNPKFAQGYYNRGLAYGKTEQYQLAINDYDQVLNLGFNTAETYNNRGNSYYKLGKHQEAINDYNQAINLGFTQAMTNREIAQGVLAEINRKIEKDEKERNAKLFNLDLGNGVILEMIKIDAGSFMMGSNERDDEKQIHQVTFKEPFFMGKYQVTQAQWKAVASLAKVNRDLSPDPSNFKDNSPLEPDEKKQGKTRWDRPVENVSWYEAREFCDRINKHFATQLKGRKIDLPSEAQWEYACKAVTSHQSPVTKYSFGDDYNKLGEYAWYDQNADKKTHPVGLKKPNDFGLYDLHGNVWEWCLDDWHSNYSGAPNDGSAWSIEKDSQYAVLRGGAWCDNYGRCRSAFRYYYFSGRDGRNYNIGCRFVGVGAVRT